MTHLLPIGDDRLFQRNAPRYTSYPPATQFDDRVGPEQAEAWMGRIAEGAGISLYIHIPFCRRLCWFCACRTQGTSSDAPLSPYLDAIEEEALLVAARLPAGLKVNHLHLGGGTPTLLPSPLIERVFKIVTDSFQIAPGAEISVEVDPTEIDDVRLDALAAAGMTRASLGVQDFDETVQAAIGRPQSFAQTRSAIDGLRDRGVDRINLDLLYGLPHQTATSLGRTLDQALALRPDRMALYGYAHVPWASKRQVMISDSDLPDGPARLGLFGLACDRLLRDGYDAIGIDHFAKPDDELSRAARNGRLHRNFQGYTTDEEDVLIGLGASAISRYPHGYAQNAARTADWRSRVGQGRLATVRGHALNIDDLFRGLLIERLLCDFSINPQSTNEPRKAANLVRKVHERWPRATDIGEDGLFTIKDEARPLARLIAMELDAYAVPDGRHSRAI